MEAVREFDQDSAHIVTHREQHLAHVFFVTMAALVCFTCREFGQLGHRNHQTVYGFAKFFRDFLTRYIRIFDGVVQ